MRLTKQSISDQAAQMLRKQIMLHELKEGTHLKESELSEVLGVSRGPIREAIKKLEAEGFVETRTNGRSIVQPFTEKEVQDLYDARILIETNALLNIRPEIVARYLPTLQLALKEMEESRIIDDVMIDNSHIEADVHFHYTLVCMSENKTLMRMWQSLNETTQTLIEVTARHTLTRKEKIQNEHLAIVDAIIEYDVTTAQKALTAHLMGASNYYSEAVFKIESRGEYDE
ncbi:MAG TPA: GntR family transcriptional regulator [Savagea sp.]